MCSVCFEIYVNSHLKDAAKGCQIPCSVCQHQNIPLQFVFDMRAIACQVTPQVYTKCLDRSAQAALRQARQAEADEKLVRCYLCHDNHINEEDSVQCDQQHILCNDCFDNYVGSQLTNDDTLLQFQANGGKLHCHLCKTRRIQSEFVFDVQTIALHVTAQVYARYIQFSTETAVIRARDQMEKKLSAAQDEIEKLKAADPDEVEIGTRLLYYFSVTCNGHAVYCSAPCS